MQRLGTTARRGAGPETQVWTRQLDRLCTVRREAMTRPERQAGRHQARRVSIERNPPLGCGLPIFEDGKMLAGLNRLEQGLGLSGWQINRGLGGPSRCLHCKQQQGTQRGEQTPCSIEAWGDQSANSYRAHKVVSEIHNPNRPRRAAQIFAPARKSSPG